MAKKKKGKSQADQHIWKEVQIEPELFAAPIDIPEVTEEEAAVIKEAKLVVQELLFDRVAILIDTHLTDHQKIVLSLLQNQDRTYKETADILGRNYTAIPHAIKGIKSKKHDKFHGGYEKKLQKICAKDERCAEYIECIKELRKNEPSTALEYLIKFDEDPDHWKNFNFSE